MTNSHQRSLKSELHPIRKLVLPSRLILRTNIRAHPRVPFTPNVFVFTRSHLVDSAEGVQLNLAV